MPDLPISAINTNDANARELRRIQKYGVHVSDFLAISGTKAYPGFGSGNDYTVANWISSGAFANLAAVQAVYPIVQSTSDYVDWVIIQSAIDFTIYGSLGASGRSNMKRKLILPAGNFKINRTLHIGYGTDGTPPVGLNGNGYVGFTMEGEGAQYDPSGNGMNGTTITTTDLTFCGIAITRGVGIILKYFTIQGPYDNYLANNNPYRTTNGWDVNSWRRTSPPIANDNWLEGNAVNCGVIISPYTSSASAAAYPARPLPSYFGGGTTQAFSSFGGSGVHLENVDIRGFIIGLGRPYGDTNDEFIRFHHGNIVNCVYGVVMRHSQNRNVSIRDCNIGGFHTAITNRGGSGTNANIHGAYDNIHFGTGYRLIYHDNGGWTGPLTLTNCYAESFLSIGSVQGRALKLDTCQISFIEQEASDGVPPYHYYGTKLILDNTTVGITRHGFITGSWSANDKTSVIMINGSIMDTQVTTRNNPSNSTFNGHPNLTQIVSGFGYMRCILAQPGRDVQIFDDQTSGEYGRNLVDTNRTDETIDTHCWQEWTEFYAKHPVGDSPDFAGSHEMQGAVQSFRVPKISAYQFGGLNITARSGYDLTCSRLTFGSVKMDVGDMIMLDPGAPDATRAGTWFVITAISGSTMTIRQLNNFDSTNATNYFTNNWQQVGPGWSGNAFWICTRIKQNHRLWVGDVTAGSNVITNVRNAFRFGATDDFVAGSLGMQIGDIFLHQEIERANTGGSGLSTQNIITNIDFTANTITLTNNFNITRTNYPIVFFVDVHNA